MRVVDLGIDPSSRMIDVVVVLLTIIGIFGPEVRPWVEALAKWRDGTPRVAVPLAKVRRLHLGKLPVGRLLINKKVAWVLLVLVILSIMLLLARAMPMLMGLFVGPAIAIALVANVLDLDDALPDAFHLPCLDSWRVLGFRAIPVMMIDPDGEREPTQALHRGSKMYVLYDPCEEEVLLESVGSVRLKLIERVDCRSP